ncbi:hypothetical protein LPJ60_005196 [Coemansia sp. RSA 2675]|uniref:Uncharacterized protein n=2 Tax=Coemansia TaxID=4863 RepID=A0A9W8L2R7_9FUNG|nr:hypothetical protein LPJ60_005196 [Coemansia sp. RSA 2675]KAJ2009652.1 hypothetical protein GGI06_005165 [Coemansia sp. S85]KAJ2414923.1 hypothetical protein GGI10_002044 [Coemansia sp. RSA 2530]KAJ2685313.1 hypothetical protein IWW39_004349 [Coemansia spiralis]KAJ2696765.1 hypothetical protein H4218_004396 [Coemansia sp. IMI 209128]KAJ2789569.1 hypothetical protein GGI18_002326 [Coemansia linderi]
MSAPEDPTAHEIIVLSPNYHLSVHFPQGSLYADVWLGINTGDSDLLVHISEMRRRALNTSPPSETASDDDSLTAPVTRKDSGCGHPTAKLSIRHSYHGLSNCPKDKRPQDWLVAKESVFEATSVCPGHHGKFTLAVDKMLKLDQARLPDLTPLRVLLDDMMEANNSVPGPMDSPSCGICRASPYTRLFFSML